MAANTDDRVVSALTTLSVSFAALNASFIAESRATRDDLDEINEALKESREDRRDLGDRITRLEGKVNAWTAIQATFTAIASAIAGFIGTRH